MPGNRLVPKEKKILKQTKRRHPARATRRARGPVTLNGNFWNRTTPNVPCMIGDQKTATKTVKVSNSPAFQIQNLPPPLPSSLRGSNKPIKGFGNDS